MITPIAPRRDHRPRPSGSLRGAAVIRVGALGGLDLLHISRFLTPSRPHAHLDFEIGVIVEGERLVRCKGVTWRAKPESIVVFNPREAHSGLPVDGVGSRYRAFLLPAAALAPGRLDGEPWFPEPIIHDPELAARLIRAHTRLSESPAESDAGLDETLRELVTRYARPAPLLDPSADGTAVRLVRTHLERHYAEPAPLRELAGLAGVGVFRLVRKFREATGLPPHAYLEQVRVARAVDLFRKGHEVTAVAYRTGFYDQSHLSRFFVRSVGISPGRYRRVAAAGG